MPGAAEKNQPVLEGLALAASLTREAIEHQNAGRISEAIDCLNRAILAKQNYGQAYFVRGALFHALLNTRQMLFDFQMAIQFDPANAEMMRNIGVYLILEKHFLQAVPILQRAVELEPSSETGWRLLANAHYLLGNTDSAQRMITHLAQKFPKNSAIRLADALFMPPIPMSQESIDASRKEMIARLDAFIADGLTIENPIRDMHTSLFYLGYHGRPHKEIMEPLAQFFTKACPKLAYTAPHCAKPRKNASATLTVGFVTPSAHQLTLNRFMLKVIENLKAHAGFDPVMFSSAPPNHPVVQDIRQRMRYVDLSVDLEASRLAIAKEEPDILVYLEVGCHHLMYCLPFARLAPVQMAWGGYPLTTGIPNMDYYISSTDIEPENAQADYTEKLVLLSRVLSLMDKASLSGPPRSREELGLPVGDVRLYCCPVQLFKLHPDMDRVFAGILTRDEKARIVLFNPPGNLWLNQLQKRFARIMPPEMVERILFLPAVSPEMFMHMLPAMDALLDTFHFSFGTTAYLAFSVGAPFVTWPGAYFAGRAGYRMLNGIGLNELIARSHEEVVDIALKLAQDKDFYRDMSTKIKERGDIFFNDVAIMDEFTAAMKRLYAAA